MDVLGATPEDARWVRLHGRTEPIPNTRSVQWGCLSADVVGHDLRRVRAGDRAVVDRLYVAARDVSWNTVLGRVTDVNLEQGDGAFILSYVCRHQSGPIDFTWKASVLGDRDGTLSFSMSGVANHDFDYNKIGLNVHHPQHEAVGRAFRSGAPESQHVGRLPNLVAPQECTDGALSAMSPAYSWLEVDYGREEFVRFDFEGDLFEMQDHRNWADPGFKSYATPLSVPVPHSARAGQEIFQRVRVTWHGNAAVSERRRAPTPTVIHCGDDSPQHSFDGVRMGTALPVVEASNLAGVVAALRPLALDHIRVDVRPADTAWQRTLERGARAAAELGCDLELAATLSEAVDADLGVLADGLGDCEATVARLMVVEEFLRFGLVRGMPRASVSEAARRLMKRRVPIVAGTNSYFADLNRDWNDVGKFDGIGYPVNSQAHLVDDEAILENVRGQAETVLCARHHGGALPIHISLVSFLLSEGPFSLAPGTSFPAPGLDVDDRQGSLLGAVWTLATIRELFGVGISSLTLYDAVGSRGLIAHAGKADEEIRVNPLFHVVADVCELRLHKAVAPAQGTNPGVAALVFGQGEHVLLANLQPANNTVEVRLAGGASAVVQRSLDEESVDRAVRLPWDFRKSGSPAPLDNGVCRLEMSAYAYVRLDISREGNARITGAAPSPGGSPP